MKKIALAIHGGAGTILKSEMSSETEAQYREGLQTALDAGWDILKYGGAALDAVEAAVGALEDNPLFNAGKGAVFTHDGKNEMDACLMDGKTHNAGAVAAVRNVKNPIRLARLVMEKTEHILLTGDGAIDFARQMNVELAPDEYFFTDLRYEQLLRAREENQVQLDHAAQEVQSSKFKVQSLSEESKTRNRKSKIGTVGAAACDFLGNLAAATSTGGMTNKKFGRIGDTPIVGAGTYADNQTCAVSCTGHGEFFMRTIAAYDVACRMKYKNLSLSNSANEVVENLREIGGEGGLIAVDAKGNVALPFNSEGMYRAFITSDGAPVVEIYRSFPLGIKGGKGDDPIEAGAGDDTVDGGAGRDDINGSKGRDKLTGGAGNDVIYGGGGGDAIDGGDGDDYLESSKGNDTIKGGKGKDILSGGIGDETLKGDGDDVLYAGQGKDKLYGEKGNNKIYSQTDDTVDKNRKGVTRRRYGRTQGQSGRHKLFRNRFGRISPNS